MLELGRTRNLLENRNAVKAELDEQLERVEEEINMLNAYIDWLKVGDWVNAIQTAKTLWDDYRLTVHVTDDILEAHDEIMKAEYGEW